MNVAIDWQTLCQRLVIVFAHFLWQAALVGLALAVSLRLASRAQANTRYALACLAITLLHANGTFLMTTITTNPGSLLSAHLGNEEVWQRSF